MAILYKEMLMENGIVDTRAVSLAAAMNTLHASISAMDSYNLDRLQALYPDLLFIVNHFGAIEELRTFDITRG